MTQFTRDCETSEEETLLYVSPPNEIQKFNASLLAKEAKPVGFCLCVMERRCVCKYAARGFFGSGENNAKRRGVNPRLHNGRWIVQCRIKSKGIEEVLCLEKKGVGFVLVSSPFNVFKDSVPRENSVFVCHNHLITFICWFVYFPVIPIF